MKLCRVFVPIALLSLAPSGRLLAADKITVTVSNPAGLARPAETIAVSFVEIRRRLPDMRFDHLQIKDASGAIVPAQGTNYQPEEHQDNYVDLVFQHDFAAGEKTAAFTIERPPTRCRRSGQGLRALRARTVRRLRLGERPRRSPRLRAGLDTPAAGKSR